MPGKIFLILAVLVVAGAVFAYVNRGADAKITSNVTNNTSDSSLTLKEPVKQIDQNSNASNIAEAEPVPDPSVQPADSPPAAQDTAKNAVCAKDVNQLVADLNHDVRKERSHLDSSLGWPPVGATISSEYVAGYNDKVSQIYERYKQAAERAGCSFTAPSPVLPLSYPY